MENSVAVLEYSLPHKTTTTACDNFVAIMVDESKVRAALEGLKSGKYKSVRVAATAEGLKTHTTLLNWLKGGQSNREAHASRQACTPEEEETLVQWIKHWDSQEFPIQPEELREMASHLILNHISDSRRDTISTYLTSINWPAHFRKRHSDLKGLFAKPIEKSRSNVCTL